MQALTPREHIGVKRGDAVGRCIERSKSWQVLQEMCWEEGKVIPTQQSLNSETSITPKLDKQGLEPCERVQNSFIHCCEKVAGKIQGEESSESVEDAGSEVS